MKNYVILSDSTSDMSRELREEYGIEYIKMGFSDNSRDYEASLDWDNISPSDFYNAMRNGVTFKTVQVPVQSFDTVFRAYLERELDILYIGCSSALSGSVNSAALVADKLAHEYPDAKIYCIDSLISGMGQGLITIKCAQLKREGKDIDAVRDWAEENKFFYNQCGTTASLEYLKKSGRVTASSAFFGDLFAVKPIIISDMKGQNLAIRKVKGRRTALAEAAAQTARYIVNPLEQTIWIGHADCEADALIVKGLIKEKLGDVKVELDMIGPIVGASVGPGTIITYYYGSKKSLQTAEV